MRKKTTIQVAFLALFLLPSLGWPQTTNRQQSSESARLWELKGLKTVMLYVYVDSEIADHREIRKRIEKSVRDWLVSVGISVTNARTMMVVSVSQGDINCQQSQDCVLVEVSAELREEVRLLRKGSSKEPLSAVTWHMSEWDSVRRGESQAFIQESVEDVVGYFLEDFQDVNRRNLNH